MFNKKLNLGRTNFVACYGERYCLTLLAFDNSLRSLPHSVKKTRRIHNTHLFCVRIYPQQLWHALGKGSFQEKLRKVWFTIIQQQTTTILQLSKGNSLPPKAALKLFPNGQSKARKPVSITTLEMHSAESLTLACVKTLFLLNPWKKVPGDGALVPPHFSEKCSEFKNRRNHKERTKTEKETLVYHMEQLSRQSGLRAKRH